MGENSPEDVGEGTASPIRFSDAAVWIIVVIGLVLVGCGAWFSSKSRTYHSAYEYYERSHYQYEVAEAQKRECRSRPTVEEALDCYEIAEKAARDHHREEQDLNAQRQMADWAFYMTIVTFGVGISTVGVASIGVYWVRETLAETRRLGEAQVRAYLSGEGGLFEISPQGLRIIVKYVNRGQSPCLSVSIKGNAIFSTPAITPRFPGDNDLKYLDEARNTWGMVPAGGSDQTFLRWSAEHIGDNEIRAIVSGTGQFRAVGTLSWVDVFDRTHSISLNLWSTGEETVEKDCRSGRLYVHHSRHYDKDEQPQ